MVLDEHTALADAILARDAGADIVEFRVDELFTGGMDQEGNLEARELRSILRLVKESPLPCIVTCRAVSEGGAYDGDDMARVALYERLGIAQGPDEHPPRYLDIEYSTYVRSANLKQKVNLAVDHPRQQRDVRTALILSMHDFQGRPANLLRRVDLMQSEPAARVVKVAFMARSIRDNLEVFDLLAENGMRGHDGHSSLMIAVAMGQFGLMSRVLAPKFGAFLTFASLREAAATAPGQPTLAQLKDLYRFECINARTRVYGVIGWPVEHSLSPMVHNAGFEACSKDTWEVDEAAGGGPGKQGQGSAASDCGFNGVFVPMPVPPEWEHFKATLSALIDHPRLDFHGCAVTLPHKQHLVRFARESMALGSDGIEWSIDALSGICGAANTLVLERDSAGLAVRARVLNTDAMAAVSCLSEVMGELAGKRIGLIGAGGVARAIAAGLLHAGSEVVVYNRTLENAARLAEEINRARRGIIDTGSLVAAHLDEVGGMRCDAFVNCTPVGMARRASNGVAGAEPSDEPNRSPVSVEDLVRSSPETVVFDTVYTPLRTPLLEQATLAGLRTVEGLGMFVRQAGEQFAAWTGVRPPLRLFEQVARESLAERRQ